MKSEEIKDFIEFQINRQIVSLYKRYIIITEDLLQEHHNFTKKVKDVTSPEFVNNIDYFDEEKYNYIRKKILDAGNETIRDLAKILDVMDITLNEKKVKDLKLTDMTKLVKLEQSTNKKNIKVKGQLI